MEAIFSESSDGEKILKGRKVMKIRIQRAVLAAKTTYDFRMLERDDFFLIPCRIEEEKETVCMNFDLRGMKAFGELGEAEEPQKLAALLRIADLEELYQRYEFSLAPENLYYDIAGKVKVRTRDILPACQKDRSRQFLKHYQALIAFILEGLRSYEDYLCGGLEILKGKSKLVQFLEPESVGEEKNVLSEYYNQMIEADKKNIRRVGRKKYKVMLAYSICSVFFIILLTAATLYSFVWYIPRQEKLIAADAAYLQKDYKAMIDGLREFRTEELGYTQKVVLASAYVQGQAVDNFSVRDKEMILSRITEKSGEEVLDYWIHLGRLEIREAENLAMKMSDNQLLLYAYMYELDQVEDDGMLTGAEKQKRKQELMQEIETLADKLGISHENVS